MNRRRKLQASTTLGGVPRVPQRSYGTSVMEDHATTVTLGAMLDAMALVRVHVTTVELGERGHRMFMGALRAMADDRSAFVVADPTATANTYKGIRIVERPDFHPDQAELVFSDGHREPLALRQHRDA